MKFHPGHRTRGGGAAAIFAALISVIAVSAPRFVFAHPMGNFSISHFAGIRLEADWVELRYILDLAEIPTFQEMQATGIVANPGDPRVTGYLSHKVEALKNGLIVTLNGKPIELETRSEDLIFPPGAGNLPTMKIGVLYRASLRGVVCPCTLEYHDANYPERVGWKEVVVTAAPEFIAFTSTAPAVSRSQQLGNYPTDLINSPPQDLAALVTFASSSLPVESSGGGGRLLSSPAQGVTQGASPSEEKRTSIMHAAEPQFLSKHFARKLDKRAVSQPPAPAASPQKLDLEANKQATPRNRFTELIASNQWGLWFVLTAALVAAALGGLHALEPGHGKTIVAAYLVGSQGTAAHALLLGLIVTVTHTAGVYALGFLTLYASRYIVPEHLYPWLGMGSGLTIAVLGLYMLRRRYAGHDHAHGAHHHHVPWDQSSGHEHAHSHQHDHGPGDTHTHANDSTAHVHFHGPHPHHHQGHGHTHGAPNQFSYKQLVTLGVTGGIIPCPAALVVLLSAVSLHRVAFGLYLILAFSLGLAAVLISIGMVTVYARRLLTLLPSDGPLVDRWLPMASATVITCLGVGIAIQSLLTAGVIQVRL